jgi:hypothetical protein
VDQTKAAFVWMALWIAFGLVLEGLLGTKQPAYLLAPVRREMWRLAHAHGVLMTAVFILVSRLHGFGGRSAPERLMAAGAILMPLGFFLGGITPGETDPAMGVWLAPLGGLLYLLGLAHTLLGPMNKAR